MTPSALLPSRRPEAAQASGRFDAEIVPVPVKVKKEIVEFKKDEFPRAGSTPEGLAKLKGAFPVGPEGVEEPDRPHLPAHRDP